MAGPYWVIVVCLGATFQDEVTIQERVWKEAESVHCQPSVDSDCFADNVHRIELWTLYLSTKISPSSFFEYVTFIEIKIA